MMSEGFFKFWQILPFVWGGIGVLIILVTCIRELFLVGRNNQKG